MCIPGVQRKEVVMYFCLHAFWQSSVIIHKRLATVTKIRESASCQKNKHQNSSGSCGIIALGMLSIYCLISQERNSFESGNLCPGLQNLRGLAQSIKCLLHCWFGILNVFCTLIKVCLKRGFDRFVLQSGG